MRELNPPYNIAAMSPAIRIAALVIAYTRLDPGPRCSLFRVKALRIVTALVARRRFAYWNLSAFAQLFVKEFFPAHVPSILGVKRREALAQQVRQRLPIGQTEIFPKVVLAHAGMRDDVGEQACLFTGSRGVVEQQGDNVVELIISMRCRALIGRVRR
jgi:hypothetical protein